MNMCKPLMLFLVLITFMVIGYHQTMGQCLPVIANDSDNSLCEGEALTLTASITLPAGCILGGGAPYIWTGPGAPGATGTPQITIGAAGAGDYSVAVVVAQDGTLGAPACPCVGTQGASNTVTVNPTPATPSIGAVDVEICEGENLELLYTGAPVSGGTFGWTGPNGFSSTTQDPVIFNAPVANTGAYTLTIVDGNGCTSPVSTALDVVVNANPEDPDAPDVDFCPGYPATIEATGTGTILWYDAPVGGNPIFTGSPFETQVLNQTTIFYVEVVDDATGCVSNRVAVTANMLGPIPQPVARDTIVCAGDPATLLAIGTGTAGNSIVWYDVPFDGTPLETDLMPPATQTYTTPFGLLTTTTFYVAELDALTGCESERTSIKVVVMPEVPEPVAIDVEACEGDAVTLTATHGAGSNLGDFYWFDAATDGILLGVGQNLAVPANLIANAGAYTFYVEERYNECISPTREAVTVTVNANPVAPMGIPANICLGSSAMLSAEGTAGNNLKWYADAQGNNLLFTGGTYETPILNQTTTYWVQQETPTTGCVSPLVAVTATVMSIPQNPSATDVTVCNDENVVIVASGSGDINTQINLYVDIDDTTPLQSTLMPPANVSFDLGTLAAGTFTYYIEEENFETNCASSRVPVTVIVQATATPPNVVDPTICEGTSTSLTATSSGATNGVFNWYSDATLTNLLGTGSSFDTGVLTETTQYYVTEATGVCESPATLVTVTVNPQPSSPTVIVPTAVCVGTTVTFNATGSGGILNWYSDGTGTNQVGSGNSFTSSALTQSTTYWVQEVTIGTGCTSALVPVTVEVLPGPTAPSANDITICENTIGEITAAGSGTGSLLWFDVAIGGSPLQTDAMPPSHAIFEVGPLTTGTYTYYVAEDNGDCTSTRTAVTLTVTPAPAVPNVQSPVAICEGEDVSMTASSTTANAIFNWYDDAGNLLFTGTTYTAINLTNSASFTVKEVLNDCESAGATVTVNVNPTLEAPTASAGIACEGETAELSASTTSGFILNWYEDNNGANLLGSGTTFTTPALTQSTTFWVQAFNPTTGCTSVLVPVSAIVVPTPAAPSANSITICEGETGEILATGSGTGSLVWYDVATGGVPLQTDLMPPVNAIYTVTGLPAGVYTYYVEEVNNGCTSTRIAVTVTVNAVPAAPIVNAPIATCEGEEATMTASSGTNGTFLWYDATGTNLLFTGSTYITPPLTETTSYIVTEVVDDCESVGELVVVNVNPKPANPEVFSANLCTGQQTDLIASTTTGLFLNWYSDNTANNLLFTGTTFTTPILTQTTTFWVQALNPTTGCVSDLVPVTATVNEVPTAPSATGITICEGEIGEIVVSGSGTGTISWYTVPVAGASIQDNVMPPANATLSVGPLPAGTYTYYVEESNGICASSRTPVTVVVKPTPAPPSVQAPVATCMGGTASMTASSATNGTFKWYDATGTILLFTGNQYVSNVLTETTTFMVSEIIDGCESDFTEVLVNVNPLPMTPFIAPVTICAGSTAAISGMPAAGNTLNWYADANASTLLFSGNTYETPILTQTTIFYVQEMNGTTVCVSELVAVTVTVEPLPVAPTAEDITICEGEIGILSASGSGLGTLNLYDEASGTGTPLQTTGMPPATATFEVGPFTAGTYVFYVAEENTDCSSERTAVTVNVTPAPAAPIVASVTICEDDQTTLTATSNASGNGEFHWYSDAAGTDLLYVGNNYPTGVLSATTTYYVSEVVNGCESPATPITVIVNPLPVDPVPSPATACEGQSIELTATSEVGTIINWYSDVAGTNLLGTGNNLTTPELFQNTVVWIQSIVPGTGCKSNLIPVPISVQPAPSTPAVVDITICTGETGEINAIGSGNGVLNWYDSPSSTTPIQVSTMPPNGATLSVGPFATTGTFAFYVEEENNGCSSDRVAVAVIVTPMPGAPIAGGTSICEGESTILTAAHSTATQGVFNWYDESGTELLGIGVSFNTGPLTATTTYQVVESTDGCESNPTIVMVVVNENPSAPTVANVQTCEGAEATLAASATTGNIINWYDDDAGSNLLGTGTTFTTPILTQTTTYWVAQITQGSGCSSELVPVTVTVNPSPTPPSAADITICENEVGTIIASGSGNGSLIWYPQAEGGFPLQSSPMPPSFATLNVGPFVPDVYVFYVAENNGTCISSRTAVTVTVVPAPNAPIASGTTICEGETAILNAVSSNGTHGDFNWYDVTGNMLLYTGGTFNTGVLTETTSYLVREVDNSCESPTTLVTVVVNPAPEIPGVADLSICEGETATISATANTGEFINWYDDAVGSNLLFTGANFETPVLMQTTTFWVHTLVIGTGCTSTLVPVPVTVNPAPATPASTNITVCEGEIATFVASGTGDPNTQLRWFENNITPTPLQVNDMAPATSASFEVGPFAAGTYTYYIDEYNTATGCSSPRTAVEVIVLPKPVEPSVDDLEICAGETATIDAPGTGTFNWYDSAVDGNLLQIGLSYTTPVLTETTSFFITHEVNGCESDREEIVVKVNPLPATPVISSNAPLCEGDTLVLKASTLPGVSYVWTGPNQYQSTVQSPNIPSVTEADHQGTYTLHVIDNTTGCVSVDTSLFVEIHPLPQTPSISSNSPVCAGDDLVLNASEIFGATSYIWVLPNDSIVTTSVPTLTIPMVNAANSGNYGVSVVVNGCNSGIASTKVTVIGLGSVPVVNSNSPVCEGSDLILMTDAISGAIYQWSGPDSFSSNVQNPIIEGVTIQNMGTYELRVTVNGCETSAPGTTFVEVVPGPVIAGISSNSPVCQGENVEIEAPFIPNATYIWYNMDGDSVGESESIVIRNAVQALHQGTYTLVVTDTLTGCSATAETRIFVDGGTGLVILADNNGPTCAGEDVQLTVNVTPQQPNATYEWYGPAGSLISTEQNPILTAVDTSDAGVYSVLVNGNSGCLSGSMNSTTLEVNPALNVNAGPDVTMVEGEPVQLSASGADVYSWIPALYLDNSSVPNPVVDPPVGVHEYVVTGMSIDGCIDTDTLIVTVEPQVDVLGVYDLFTPNGDGVNDTFVIEFIKNLENYTLSIYNRGGIELITTSNYLNDWDGTYRGRDVPEGTYWYVIRTDEGKEYKGAVTLIR